MSLQPSTRSELRTSSNEVKQHLQGAALKVWLITATTQHEVTAMRTVVFSSSDNLRESSLVSLSVLQRSAGLLEKEDQLGSCKKQLGKLQVAAGLGTGPSPLAETKAGALAWPRWNKGWSPAEATCSCSRPLPKFTEREADERSSV